MTTTRPALLGLGGPLGSSFELLEIQRKTAPRGLLLEPRPLACLSTSLTPCERIIALFDALVWTKNRQFATSHGWRTQGRNLLLIETGNSRPVYSRPKSSAFRHIDPRLTTYKQPERLSN
jgi:hypothetical protein